MSIKKVNFYCSDEVCILSASGTAAVVNMHQREGSKLMNRRSKARSSKKEQPDNGITVIEDTEDPKEEKTTKISIENNNKVSWRETRDCGFLI
jgi:hypothetical protein